MVVSFHVGFHQGVFEGTRTVMEKHVHFVHASAPNDAGTPSH